MYGGLIAGHGHGLMASLPNHLTVPVLGFTGYESHLTPPAFMDSDSFSRYQRRGRDERPSAALRRPNQLSSGYEWASIWGKAHAATVANSC